MHTQLRASALSLDGRFKQLKETVEKHLRTAKVWQLKPGGARPLLAIANHFKFVMENAFVKHSHSHLIMIEDDLEVDSLCQINQCVAK